MSDQNAKCPYNDGVVCAPIDWRGRAVERNCDACGWNPKVAKARMENRLAAAKTEKTIKIAKNSNNALQKSKIRAIIPV